MLETRVKSARIEPNEKARAAGVDSASREEPQLTSYDGGGGDKCVVIEKSEVPSENRRIRWKYVTGAKGFFRRGRKSLVFRKERRGDRGVERDDTRGGCERCGHVQLRVRSGIRMRRGAVAGGILQ